MPFSDALARMEAAVFGRLGEDASWTGVAETVRVIRREADEDVGFIHGTAIATGHRIRVRKAEVPAPQQGDEVQILDAAGDPVDAALFTVTSEPKLDRKGVWSCDVTPA